MSSALDVSPVFPSWNVHTIRLPPPDVPTQPDALGSDQLPFTHPLARSFTHAFRAAPLRSLRSTQLEAATIAALPLACAARQSYFVSRRPTGELRADNNAPANWPGAMKARTKNWPASRKEHERPK